MAAAGAEPVDVRAQDGLRREEPRAEVRDGDARLHRRQPFLARDGHDPRHALRDEVESTLAGVGARLAETGDGGVDERRVDRREVFVTESERAHHAGPVVFHEDVRLRRERPEDRLAARILQIDDDAALVAVDGPVAGAFRAHAARHAAGGIPLRRLDLDHVRAHVAEEHGAERTGHDLRQIQYADACQRAHRLRILRPVRLVHSVTLRLSGRHPARARTADTDCILYTQRGRRWKGPEETGRILPPERRGRGAAPCP